MAFLRGKALLPENTPLVQKNPWEYISVIYENNRKKSMVPVADAMVRVLLPGSRDQVTAGLTSDDGEFFLRVPSGEEYFVEVYSSGQLVLLSFQQVKNDVETDAGILDSLTTAYALYAMRKIWLGEKHFREEEFRAEEFRDLCQGVEECWMKGEGLENYSPYQQYASISPAVVQSFDPLEIFEECNCVPGKKGKNVECRWIARRPGRCTLYYRSFRSRPFRRESTRAPRRKGRISVQAPSEFEGYLFFLEFQDGRGFLARTPLRSLRTPIREAKRSALLAGRQEGPITVAHREVDGYVPFPGERGPMNLKFKRAREKNVEAEIDLEFSRKREIPRFMVREGFQDVELNLYFPQEHSFLWGPMEKRAGFSVEGGNMDSLTTLWKKLKVEYPDHSIVEAGFSTPFAEITGFRDNESYRLFSASELIERISFLSFRRVDSLGLESVMYYRGKIRLDGEGLFEGYIMEVDMEGKFEEEKNRDLHPYSSGDISGNTEFLIDYSIKRTTGEEEVVMD